MLINPYKNVDWKNYQKIQGNTHNHLFYQWHVDNAYENGMQFIGAHPHYGKPLYPMSEYGMTLPQGAVEYALAEHYGTSDIPHPAHFAVIGSTITTDESSPHSGYNGTMNEFLDEIRNNLQTEDGGGLQWNHAGAIDPSPQNPTLLKMKQMYDYAPDIFLGVEFYNDSQGKTYEGKNPWMKGWWDALLKSGRHVWGFANPDYEARRLEPEPDWNGKAILLVPEFTRDNCLKAIRNGEFFLTLKNNGFHFTNITSNNNTVEVTLSGLGNVKFVTASREVYATNTNSANLTVTKEDVYVRIEATQNDEQIFSQALMLEGIEKRAEKRLVNNRAILI